MLLLLIWLLVIIVARVNAFNLVAASPEWRAVQTLKSVAECREAIQGDSVVLFTSSTCEVCNTVAAVFHDVAESLNGKHKFFSADTRIEPMLRIAQVLQIPRVPTLVLYMGSDVYSIPCTVTTLTELQALLHE